MKSLYQRGPVRKGPIYCSPWCGGGCTWASYRKCVADAKLLAAAMSNGWTIDVRENLKWFWYVWDATKTIRLTMDGPGSFLCYIGLPGDAGIKWAGRAKTPHKAIEIAQAAGRVEMEGHLEMLLALKMYDQLIVAGAKAIKLKAARRDKK